MNDQDAWQRFSQKHAAKSAGPAASFPPVSPPAKEESKDSGRSYVIVPAAKQTDPQPQVEVETTVVPHYYPGGMVGGIGLWGGPFGGFGPGYGLAGPAFGLGLSNPGFGYPEMTMERQTRIIQTGPSRPSGNYYAPSSPDPSASGNYYDDSTAQPKAAPIVHQDNGPSDYWGAGHNPLPDSLQAGGGNR